MTLQAFAAAFLAASSLIAQTPSGRWDGSITLAGLQVPFQLHFDGPAETLTASFVNGGGRAAPAKGSFTDGVLRLSFPGAALEARLDNGELRGKYGPHPFRASAYCTCGSEGEAGPGVSGRWQAPASWRLKLERKGDDTLAWVANPSGEWGPLSGRFDGIAFLLHYYDGTRGAVLELEPRKDGGLDAVWKEPGKSPQRFLASRERNNE